MWGLKCADRHILSRARALHTNTSTCRAKAGRLVKGPLGLPSERDPVSTKHRAKQNLLKCTASVHCTDVSECTVQGFTITTNTRMHACTHTPKQKVLPTSHSAPPSPQPSRPFPATMDLCFVFWGHHERNCNERGLALREESHNTWFSTAVPSPSINVLRADPVGDLFQADQNSIQCTLPMILLHTYPQTVVANVLAVLSSVVVCIVDKC